MTLTFHPPTLKTVRQLCALAVRDDQRDLVSPAAYTLSQAPFEPGAVVRGAWLGDEPVALFAMIDPRVPTDVSDLDCDPPEDAAYLWRLLVDAKYQGRGYGLILMDEAERIARAWGMRHMFLHAYDRPGGSIPFYERLGYRRTGREDTEVELIRDLTA